LRLCRVFFQDWQKISAQTHGKLQLSIKPLFSDLEHLPQAKVEKHGIKTTYFIKSLLHGPTQYAIWMTKGA
jgi:hypothetical protein